MALQLFKEKISCNLMMKCNKRKAFCPREKFKKLGQRLLGYAAGRNASAARSFRHGIATVNNNNNNFIHNSRAFNFELR